MCSGGGQSGGMGGGQGGWGFGGLEAPGGPRNSMYTPQQSQLGFGGQAGLANPYGMQDMFYGNGGMPGGGGDGQSPFMTSNKMGYMRPGYGQRQQQQPPGGEYGNPYAYGGYGGKMGGGDQMQYLMQAMMGQQRPQMASGVMQPQIQQQANDTVPQQMQPQIQSQWNGGY